MEQSRNLSEMRSQTLFVVLSLVLFLLAGILAVSVVTAPAYLYPALIAFGLASAMAAKLS